MAHGGEFHGALGKLAFGDAPSESRDDLLGVCFTNVANPAAAGADGATDEIRNISMRGGVKMQFRLFDNNY